MVVGVQAQLRLAAQALLAPQHYMIHVSTTC